MPKHTFYNLPEEKKDTLIDAAKKEFSRVPLFEASISNIVKVAKIPRGSFYQYFEGKEDVFFYLLEKRTEDMNKKFIAILRQNKGDLFKAFLEVFKHLLYDFKNPENRNFFKHTFLNMNHEIEIIFYKMFHENKREDDLTSINAILDKEKLNIENEYELPHVMQILKIVTVQNLIQNFAKEISFEKAIEKYELEINLLKNGLYKDKSSYFIE
ncbi:MAG TPA: TetR family transcriptional regulator [Virgibacillus sp.]|nr:TetR family transcriptional regulator [Virgibacillus sp.]HLR68597.1 TetR family transcriptional regulator [Virgibacillus sp.]